MKRYCYDFHIHSCLSPCGDNDMTPNNIAGMAKLNGLDIAALTDHNSCLNCPAFFEAAERYGIVPIAGMELTTAEDIHVVCLFETLDGALSFNDEVGRHRIRIANRPDIFGEQLILDGNDEIIGREEALLINATNLSLDDVPRAVNEHGGVCWPAHVDREANGIIATLGDFPDSPYFAFAEFYDSSKRESYKKLYPILADKQFFISSDAHYLENMREDNDFILLEESDRPDAVRHELFELLRSGKRS